MASSKVLRIVALPVDIRFISQPLSGVEISAPIDMPSKARPSVPSDRPKRDWTSGKRAIQLPNSKLKLMKTRPTDKLGVCKANAFKVRIINSRVMFVREIWLKKTLFNLGEREAVA